MSSLPGLVLIVHLFGLVEGAAAFALHDTFAVPFDRIAPIAARHDRARRSPPGRRQRQSRGRPLSADSCHIQQLRFDSAMSDRDEGM